MPAGSRAPDARLEHPGQLATLMNSLRTNLSPNWLPKALLPGIVYAVVARASLGLAFESSNASPIWPPSGIAMVALLLGGSRLGVGIFAGAVAANLVSFLGNGATGSTTAACASLAIAAGNTLEGLFAAGLVRRLIRGAVLGTPQEAYVYLAIALAASAISASCGVLTLVALSIVGGPVAPTVWLTWWLGDTTGLLVVAPPLLSLLAKQAAWRDAAAPIRRLLPDAVVLAAACALCFGNWLAADHLDRLTSVLPIAAVALSTYRHGRAGAAWSTLAMSTVALAATLHGGGPFAKATVNDSLISLDVFLALCAVTGMVLSTTLHMPRRDPAQAVPQARQGWQMPTAMLLCGIATSVLAWHLVSAETERAAAARFAVMGDSIGDDIREQMGTYERALRGGRGLFDASNSVERGEWHEYVNSLELRKNYPGLLSIGYAAQVDARELAAFLANTRAGGAPDFAIWPPGDRGQYTPTLYVEPLDERGRRALGFDLSSEAIRRATMEKARDSGETGVTPKLVLKLEPEHDAQPGFVMVAPVFRHGPQPLATAAQRRAALEGYVLGSFRAGDLMRSILRPAELRTAELAVYDGADAEPSALLYSNAGARPERYRDQLQVKLPVDFAGHRWTLVLKSTQAFEASVDAQKAQIMLLAGSIISLLLFTIVRSLTLTRQDALTLAAQMSDARTEALTRFESLAESASDGILVLDATGRVAYCNRAGARLFGAAGTDLAGRDIRSLLRLPAAIGDWTSAALHGTGGPLETAVAGTGGKAVPVEVSLGTWDGVNGRSFSVIVRDVSARAAAEEALRNAQHDLRGIMDNMPALVASWDARLLNRFCNPEYRSWFGVEPDLAVGRHMREVLGETAYRLNLPFVTRALQGERQSFERVMLCADGRTRHAQGHYIPDVQGGEIRGVFVLVFDITQQKEIEQKLAYGLRLHDIIFRHAGVGLANVRDHVFERASLRWTELLGYAEGELDGRPESTIYPDEQARASIGQLAARVLPEGRTLDHELMLRRKDGGTVWCRLMARAIDPADLGQGAVWIVDDFSDRRQRETLLEAARAAAEDAARVKGEFLANMSHEIRTPMNGIMGMTRLTLDTELDATQRENLLIVQDSADALLRLLDDILDFSKMEAGKLELSAENFDLRSRMAATLYGVLSLAAARGLELVLDVGPDVPEFVRGDAGRLMQVLTNLLGNAVKFTNAGEIVCRAEVRAVRGDEVTLEFAVVDSGIGISREAQARIFESFVQADSSVTREHGGTGLGLAICTQIVRLMRGELGVESTPGEGSTFRFTAVFDGHSAAPALGEADARVLSGRRVSLAQENERAGQATARLLRGWGMQPVMPAAAGCDLLLIDAPLWNERGPDRMRDGEPAVPVVVIESPLHGGSPLPSRGAVRCTVRRPLRPSDLLRALVLALGAGAAAPEAAAAGSSRAQPARILDILVAEDHPVNQKLAKRVLESRGHRVTLVGDGAEAVVAAAARDFDVIVMDVQMPDMDGTAATRAIRESERRSGRHVPIVALTAHALMGERERLIAAGMDDYLSKPLDPHDLVRTVESNARRRDGDGAASTGDTSAVEAADIDMNDSLAVAYDRRMALEGALGDAAFLDELGRALSALLPDSLRELASLLRDEDFPAAAQAAHRMVGAVGNVHAGASARAARRLEEACLAAHREDADAALRQLEAELARLVEALARDGRQEAA